MSQPEILLVNDIWARFQQVKNILTEVIIPQTGRKYEKNNTLLFTYCIVHIELGKYLSAIIQKKIPGQNVCRIYAKDANLKYISFKPFNYKIY